MINLCYVSTNMMSKYVLVGLKVAQELGDIAVTVQKPSIYSVEKAVLFYENNNLCIIETKLISVEEHEQRLRLFIAEAKNG